MSGPNTTPTTTKPSGGCGGAILTFVFGLLGIVFLLTGSVGFVIVGVIFLLIAALPLITRSINKRTASEEAKAKVTADLAEDERLHEIAAAHESLPPLDLLPPRQGLNHEVAGESYRREAFGRIFSRRAALPGSELFGPAVLIPETNNRYDANATAVWFEGEHVGYLAAEDAVRYRAVLDHIVSSGFVPRVPARVWATNDDGTWRARVTLSLAEPTEVLAANARPSGPLLPAIRTFQVTGEELHTDALKKWLGRTVYGTLHVWVEERPRSTRTHVEVRIDGERIGVLSASVSSDLLPLVSRVERAGSAAVVITRVAGNALRIDASVEAVRLGDLDDAWISAHIGS